MLFNFLAPFCFDADDGGASGGASTGSGQDDAGEAGQTGNNDGNQAGGAGGDASGDAGDDKRTFTQRELDALFAARAKQAEKAAVEILLKDLEVEDQNALKNALRAAREAEEANLSELEKAQKAVEKATSERDAAKAEAEKIQAAAAEALLKAAVIAAGGEFNDPNDLWLQIDHDKIKPKEDGQGYDGLKEEIERVKKEKPYLLNAQQRPGLGTPTRQTLRRTPATTTTDEGQQVRRSIL
jgi:hypothetical protein